MKKATFGFLAVGPLMVASCSKPANSSAGAGSWTFKSNTYSGATTFTGIDNNQNAFLAAGDAVYSNHTGTGSAMSVHFYSSTLPVTSGTYTVSAGIYPSAVGEVGLGLGIPTGMNYFPTGGNGTEKVKVTVTNGKLNISGSGITMAGDPQSDRASFSFNITQQ